MFYHKVTCHVTLGDTVTVTGDNLIDRYLSPIYIRVCHSLSLAPLSYPGLTDNSLLSYYFPNLKEIEYAPL